MINTSILVAYAKVYDELGYGRPDLTQMIEDQRCDRLTENTTRSGRDVVWYLDENHNVCVYIDTLEVLTDEEIERELC